jgi:octaprenyl-diphosphate synthase
MTLGEILAPVEQDLARVEEVIRREVACSNPFVQTLVDHALQFQGKRLRPAILLLAARIRGTVTERHLRLATIVELLHGATLVHDDVLDEARLRRRVDTLNARWGNEASVLFGDYLFARAFILCGELGSPRAWQVLTRAAQETCVGELAQVARTYVFDLPEEEYLDIVRRKTGALFAAAGELGALGADDRGPDAPRLAEYGLHLGAAFQVVDDCLDLVGEEREMGKSLGTDLAKGKVTLPLLRLYADTPEDGKPALREFLGRLNGDPADRRRLLQTLRDGGALDFAMDRARTHARQARAALAPLPDGPAKLRLQKLTDYIVRRRT